MKTFIVTIADNCCTEKQSFSCNGLLGHILTSFYFLS